MWGPDLPNLGPVGVHISHIHLSLPPRTDPRTHYALRAVDPLVHIHRTTSTFHLNKVPARELPAILGTETTPRRSVLVTRIHCHLCAALAPPRNLGFPWADSGPIQTG